MLYPADQEASVFYNPVQVQNRDLSILMITLAAERRALQHRLQQEKKNIRKEEPKIKPAELQGKLQAIEKELDPSKVLASMHAPIEGITILDALAASGLRSIRYWKEIPGVKHVTINDLEQPAVERAYANLKVNQLEDVQLTSDTMAEDQHRPHGIHVHRGDARLLMYQSTRSQTMVFDKANDPIQSQLQDQWDIIDLDPYGSAAPFLDAAVQAIASGGMLCVTCTDMAALGGSHPETAFGRYGSLPIQRAPYLQEMALRILLYSIATAAAKYGRTIRPILSVGMNFYVRCFVEVLDDKAGVNQLSLQTGHVYQSVWCPSFVLVPNGQLGGKNNNVYQASRPPNPLECEETKGPLKIGGPLWLGPLHDVSVIETALDRLARERSAADTATASTHCELYPDTNLLATKDRLIGLLTLCRDELPDVPLFWRLPDLCHTLGIGAPKSDLIRAGLLNAGYRVSGYHKDPLAIKTDAPVRVVWDILRAHAREHPPKRAPQPDSAAARILERELSISVDFSMPHTLVQQQKDRKQRDRVALFPENPTKGWGPKKAAAGYKRKHTRTGGVTGAASGPEQAKEETTSVDESSPQSKRVAK